MGTGARTSRLEQFKATYFTECSERLGTVDQILETLRAEIEDPHELFNEMFRAVHSIKGGGGAFGFDDIVELAHAFETVLDQLRQEKLQLSDGVLETLFVAFDALSAVVEATRDGSEYNNQDYTEAMRQLQALVDDPETGAATKEAVSQSEPVEAVDGTVKIHFVPHTNLFRSANDPLLIFRELRGLGDLDVQADTSKLPSLSKIDPEKSYLGWDLVLKTERSLSEVKEAFEFVEDDCLLEFGGAHSADTLEPPIEPEPESEEQVVELSKEAVPAETKSVEQELPPSPPKKVEDSKNEVGRPVPKGVPTQTASIRVDLDRVDKLVNMVGEMVITQAVMEQHLDAVRIEDETTAIGLETLSTHLRELQDDVMAIRMQPVQSLFARMPRLIREVARGLGKKVKLVTVGESTEVDKSIVENLADPLTHLIRNAVDHGIEGPDQRKAAGKPEEANITLSAAHRNGRIVIEVSDDGQGIDREKVFSKAVENGIVAADAALSDEEVCDLIFKPGFSTASVVTEVSGRGVGMDVVRRTLNDVGGRVVVHSRVGQGTSFLMSLPLTLAVMDGLIVTVGEERYVLPLSCTIESVRPMASELSSLAEKEFLMRFRDDYVPLIFLHKIFGVGGAVEDPTKGLVVFCELDSGANIGVVVDSLVEQRQVVIKSLEENFCPVNGVSSATILGDGRVSLILEVNGLHEMYKQAGKKAGLDASARVEEMKRELHP